MEKELKRVSVVPMRGMVLFPHMTLNFDAAREMSIKALESAAENDSIVFLAAQKDYTIEQPTVDDIYSIGTFAVIKQVMRMPGGITRVIVKGLERGIIENFISEKPFFEAEVQEFDDLYEENHPLKQAYIRRLKKSYEEYFSQNPKLTADNFMAVMGIEEIGELCDVIAASLEIDTKEKQEILSEFDSYDRAEKLIITIQNQLEVLKLEQQLAQKVKERIDKNQREYFFDKLDVIFPESNLREKYIRYYGNSYKCTVQNIGRLWKIFESECLKYGIIYKMKDIISAYKSGYEMSQLSFF